MRIKDAHEYVPSTDTRDSYLLIEVPEENVTAFRKLVFGA